MRLVGNFDKTFLSIKKVGEYVDIHDYSYDNQVYLAACRFNQNKVRNKGNRVSVHSINDNGKKFFRVFLIEKAGK